MNIYEGLITKENKLAIVGLGYVGLPLAVEFAKKVPTLGFDVNKNRIHDLQKGIDYTHETCSEELKAVPDLMFSCEEASLKEASFIIVAVPTPIHKNKRPDLSYLKSASAMVGRHLNRGSIVVYESTVYPGVTEDICIPILEKNSGLQCGVDFKVGYSPERINPGDKEHTLANILKIVAGMDADTLEEIAAVYALVVKAGLFKASSIKCAEAAKVIENIQRDLNIALVNELAVIFHKLNIDTQEVLEAAGTKWNFIKMQPGLVGGHCIGVDPYYLTYKAEEIGYNPQVILSGRRINDSMGKYIAEQTVKTLIQADKVVKGSTILVMGITFKENVADIRNSRVIDIIHELQEYGITIKIIDPLADPQEVEKAYGIKLIPYTPDLKADGMVVAVNHTTFKNDLSVDALKNHLNHDSQKGVVIDVKSIYNRNAFVNSNIHYWRL